MRATPRPPRREETDQTAPARRHGSIDPSADKPRVFDYEEELTQVQIDTLEERPGRSRRSMASVSASSSIDDYTPYGDDAYDAAEQLYNELDLGAKVRRSGVWRCSSVWMTAILRPMAWRESRGDFQRCGPAEFGAVFPG